MCTEPSWMPELLIFQFFLLFLAELLDNDTRLCRKSKIGFLIWVLSGEPVSSLLHGQRWEFTNCDWNLEILRRQKILSFEGLSPAGYMHRRESIFNFWFLWRCEQISRNYFTLLFWNFWNSWHPYKLQSHLMMLPVIAVMVTRGPEGDEECRQIAHKMLDSDQTTDFN